jgi:hypothetical protein
MPDSRTLEQRLRSWQDYLVPELSDTYFLYFVRSTGVAPRHVGRGRHSRPAGNLRLFVNYSGTKSSGAPCRSETMAVHEYKSDVRRSVEAARDTFWFCLAPPVDGEGAARGDMRRVVYGQVFYYPLRNGQETNPAFEAVRTRLRGVAALPCANRSVGRQVFVQDDTDEKAVEGALQEAERHYKARPPARVLWCAPANHLM